MVAGILPKGTKKKSGKTVGFAQPEDFFPIPTCANPKPKRSPTTTTEANLTTPFKAIVTFDVTAIFTLTTAISDITTPPTTPTETALTFDDAAVVPCTDTTSRL